MKMTFHNVQLNKLIIYSDETVITLQ